MNCRNPYVDDCMADYTQSFTETFSNENSKDSAYWSDYPETPKFYERKKITDQNPCAMHVTQIVKE